VRTAETGRRYAIYEQFAVGGMASVHYGRMLGDGGFARTVAIKRLHPHLATDPEFMAMFLDESRLASRIQHPNVVSTLDAATVDGEAFIVMEYIHGESVAALARAARAEGMLPPPAVAASIACDVLHGLQAAHDARSETGEPLGIVHRDISPQNVLVGMDGVARVLDFGVARAAGRLHATRDGELKGKLGYMAPEHLQGRPVDRRADVYAVGVVLWELLTGEALFTAETEGATVTRVLSETIRPPSSIVPSLPPDLDTVLLTSLSRTASRRFPNARAMAAAIEAAIVPARPNAVGEFVQEYAGRRLEQRAAAVAKIESGRVAEIERNDALRSRVGRVVHIPEGSTFPMRPVVAPTGGADLSTRSPGRRYLVAAALAVLLAGAAAGGFKLMSQRSARAEVPFVDVHPGPATASTPLPSSASAGDDARPAESGTRAPAPKPKEEAKAPAALARTPSRPGGRAPAQSPPVQKVAPGASAPLLAPSEAAGVGVTSDRHN
jgi:serine/threonine-protein kinase